MKGPIAVATTEPVGRIAYERLLLFGENEGTLRPLSELEITTVEGERIRVTSNRDRVTAGPTVITPIWLHITRSRFLVSRPGLEPGTP